MLNTNGFITELLSKKGLPLIFRNNWFFGAIFMVLLIGLRYPAIGHAIRPFTQPLIFCAMFIMGIRQDLSAFLDSFKNYGAIFFCLLCSFVIVPLFGYILGKIFFSSNELMFAGVMIASAVSTTLVSSIVWTNITDGNESLAMVLSVITSIAFVFAAPCILYVSLDTTIKVPLVKMIHDLFIVIIPPVVLSQIIRRFLKINYDKYSNISKVIGQIIILSIILMATSSAKGLHFSVLLSVLMAVILQYTLSAFFSYKGSKLFTHKKNAIAIMYCSSQKALPNAALISMTFFDPVTSVYILVYHVFQQIMGQVTTKILSEKH